LLSICSFDQSRNGSPATTTGQIFIADPFYQTGFSKRFANTSCGTIPASTRTGWNQEMYLIKKLARSKGLGIPWCCQKTAGK
jgi:hypothetical protein